MNKLLLNITLIFTLFLALAISANATVVENDSRTQLYYTLDDADISVITVIDKVGYRNGSISGATTGITGIVNEAYDFDGSADYISTTGGGIVEEDISYSFWLKPTSGDFVTQKWVFTNEANLPTYGETRHLARTITGSGLQLLNSICGVGGITGITIPEANFTLDNWNHVVYVIDVNDGTEAAYINGNLYSNSSLTTGSSICSFNNGFRIGADLDGLNSLNMGLDEFSVWNESIKQDDVTYLYNSGTPNSSQQYPFIDNTTTEEQAEMLENTAIAKQTGTIQISNNNYQTIVSSNYEVTINNTPIYGAYSFNVAPNNNNVMTCQLLINGVQQGNVTRTNTAGETGSVFLQSPIFVQVLGNYTQELQCRKDSGAGNFVISKAVGIGHLLYTEHDDILTYQENNFEATANAGSTTYELLDQVNFTMDAHHVNDINTVVVDWGASYTNNHASTELLNSYIEIDSTNCSFSPRTVSSGATGSIGGSCVLNNLTINSTVTINYYGLGTNADYEFYSVIKEFNHDTDEVLSKDLSGKTFNGSGYVLIDNLTINNNNHALANLFTKVSLSVSASASTTANFYFNISNGVTEQSIVHSRDLTTDTGRVIFHDIIEDLALDNYTVSVYADCGGADCTVTGGEVTSYIADTTLVVLNQFLLTAFDNYDNTLINQSISLTLPDGNVVTGTEGSVAVTDEESTINATISTSDYFSYSLLNHDTTTDINISMNQTLIGWNCVEKVSGNDLNCSSPTETDVFNYNVAGNPHSQSINVTGYYENVQSFNVTALQSQVLNTTGFYSTNLSIISTSTLGSPSSCNYTITSNDYSWNEVVSGSPNTTTGLINGSYSVIADCDGYAYQTLNLTVENVTQSLTFDLFTTNSISLEFYDINTGQLMNGTNITVQFIGTTAITENTNNGTLYVDLMSPDEYTIIFDAEGYRQGSYIFTLQNKSYNTFTLYMQPENDTQLLLITVKDTYGNYISNAELTIQRYLNNSWATEQIRKTDFQGRTEAHFVLSTVFYNFLVSVDGITYFGTINDNANKKQIYAEDVSQGIEIVINRVNDTVIRSYQSLYGITTSLTFVETSNTTGYFRFSWDDSTNAVHDGELKVYAGEAINCTSTTRTESGIIYCYVNETGTKIYTATGSLDGEPVDTLNKRYTLNSDLFINWGAFGYGFLFLVLVITYFLYLESPTFSLYLGSILFSGGIAWGLVFTDVSLTVISLILALTSFVAGMSSKTGGNG